MSEMPRPPGSSDPDLWTLDLPPSQETSVGYAVGARIFEDGSVELGRENEDRYFTCKLDGVQLYMVLDGHHGSRACDFAQKRIPSLLLRYNMGENGEKAAEALKYAFMNTEKHFFMMLDPSITRKMGLQIEIQEQGGTTSMIAYSMFPDKVEELARLEEQIKGGTTAVVALILNNHQLLVANVGDSRAVLGYLDGSGKLHTEQISEDHNTRNEKELARLVECGLDEMRLRSSGRLGMHQNTRSIGDYSIKGGYKDHDILSVATKEPGIADPFISHPPLDITTIRGFLLLMSDGVYDAYSSFSNSLHTVNHDVALLVQRHMDHTHDIQAVAQGVVDEIKHNFHMKLKQERRGARLDDITLVIRNLGYPMGRMVASNATAPPAMHNPFDFSQPPKTSPAKKVVYENSEFISQQSVHEAPTYSQPYSHVLSTPGGYTHTHQPLITNAPNQHPNTFVRPPHPVPSYGSSPLSMKKSESDSRIRHGALEGQTVYPPPTGYGLQQPPSHHHTNSDGQMNHPDGPTGYPPSLTGPSIYENWGPVKSTSVRHHSSSAVGETADNLRGVNVSSPPPLPAKPVGSLASQEPTPTMPPFSTNATSQYQTSHQVLPPPVTSQPTVSQHVTPNSTPSQPTAVVDNTSGAGSSTTKPSIMKRGSSVDDESWMYDHDAVPTSINQSQELQQISEQHEEGENLIGTGNDDDTVIVKIEIQSDREEVSDMEGDEEEDGMIKPIIKFDKFPPDLSWEQI